MIDRVPDPSLRQRIAGATPAPLRKLVRMAEHLARRLRLWASVAGELRAVDAAGRRVLRASFALAPLTSLKALDGFLPPRLAGDVTIRSGDVGRFRLRAGTDDVLHVLTSREPEIRRELEARLRPGDTFVDAGANIGFYSVLASRLVGPHGRVVAFEMMPDTAAILRHHLRDNGAANVEVVEKALSDRTGAKVTASVRLGTHGQASIVADQSGEGVRRVEVATVTLDEALRETGAIRLMKMDLEGAEWLALSGAEEVLARTECLVFENNASDSRIVDLLGKKGLVVRRLKNHDFLAERIPGAAIGDPSQGERERA